MTDATVRNNATGIFVRTESGLAKAAIVNSLVAQNFTGVFASARSSVAVSETTAEGNNFGFSAASNIPGVPAIMTIDHCRVTHNTVGIHAYGSHTAIIDVSHSVITFNSIGVQPLGSVHIFTGGNNTLRRNGPVIFTDTFSTPEQ